MGTSEFSIKVSKGFREDLKPYTQSLADIVEKIEAEDHIKVEGLASILSFVIKKPNLRFLRVYADPHKKLLLISYLEEETGMDRARTRNRELNN